MKLAFTLTMRAAKSWNDAGSGAGKLHVLVRQIVGYRRPYIVIQPQGKIIVLIRNYEYEFSNGCVARITVRDVGSEEAAKLERESAGFCGYEWMVDSILKHGRIVMQKSFGQVRIVP